MSTLLRYHEFLANDDAQKAARYESRSNTFDEMASLRNEVDALAGIVSDRQERLESFSPSSGFDFYDHRENDTTYHHGGGGGGGSNMLAAVGLTAMYAAAASAGIYAYGKFRRKQAHD